MGGNKTISMTDQVIAGMSIQQSSYGLALPLVYGTNRVAGNLLDYVDFTPIAHTTSQSSGKGGGTTIQNTTYTYTAALILGLCEGTVDTIGAIWCDKATYRDGVTANYVLFLGMKIYLGSTLKTSLQQVGATFFGGALGQAPWSYMAGKHPERSLGYSGVSYVAWNAMDLGTRAGMANWSFEVRGKLRWNNGTAQTYDANPKDVVQDVLTNAVYGAGFPAARIGDWSLFSNYCVANSIFLSPVFETSKAATECLDEIFTATNSAPVWSGDTLKIIPYADQAITGNGVTYTPNVTPLYDLSDDDYLSDGSDDPIKVTRTTPADAWNQVQVEFLNRGTSDVPRDYNVEIIEAKDSANIEAYGLRTDKAIPIHSVCSQEVAQKVAQALLGRKLYIRNTYEFRLGWKYCLLEAMDPITLTDATLGLSRYLVRVISVEENDQGDLTIRAEDWPLGAALPPKYGTQVGSGYMAGYNDSPGNANAPTFMEPYFQQTNGALQLWIALSGTSTWGAAMVYASMDGNSYAPCGEVSLPSRQGVLITQMAAASAGLDTTTNVGIDMTQSRSQVLNGSDADLAAFNTLCYADGEWFAYRDSTLAATYQYTLARLQRGVFGSPSGAHAAGKQFTRVDIETLLVYPIRQDQVGQTIYFKILSRNIFGGGQQALVDVQPYSYTILGTALTAAPANPVNLCTAYQGNQAQLQWDPVIDFRPVVYEIRKGPAWATAQVLGRTPTTKYPCTGSGTYWVAALAGTAYSVTPPSLVITGQLVQNVVQTWDEAATSWSGAIAGGAYNNAGAVQLSSAGLISTITLISGVASFLALGSVASSGSYTVPSGHEVDVLNVQPCTVTANYTSQTVNPYATIGAQTSIAAMSSIVGNVANKCSVQLQINVADQTLTYGGWQNFIPGTYNGRKFKMQALLTSSDGQLTPSLSAFSWTVDVPDRSERGTSAAIAAGGTAITFTKSFQAVPNVQVTILNAVAGDDVFFNAGPTTAGFTVQIKNAGAGVARTINWVAQGY
jgi:hypothetical protein